MSSSRYSQLHGHAPESMPHEFVFLQCQPTKEKCNSRESLNSYSYGSTTSSTLAYLPLVNSHSNLEAGHSSSFISQQKELNSRDSRKFLFKTIIFSIVGFILLGLVITIMQPKYATSWALNDGNIEGNAPPASQSSSTTTINQNSRFFQVTNSNHYGILAEGYYYKNLKNSGWNHLHVKSTITIEQPFILHSKTQNHANGNNGNGVNNNNKPSPLTPEEKEILEKEKLFFSRYFASMEAMGFLEGYVTCHEINNFYINFYSGLFDGGDPAEEVVSFLLDNYQWLTAKADMEWSTSNYWLSIKILISQLQGMLQGIRRGCPGNEPDFTVKTYLPSLHKNPAMIHLLLLNANGDIYQIAQKFNQESMPAMIADDDEYKLSYDDDMPSQASDNITHLNIDYFYNEYYEDNDVTNTNTFKTSSSSASSSSSSASSSTSSSFSMKDKNEKKSKNAKKLGGKSIEYRRQQSQQLFEDIKKKRDLKAKEEKKEPQQQQRQQDVQDILPTTTTTTTTTTNFESTTRFHSRTAGDTIQSVSSSTGAATAETTKRYKRHGGSHCSALVKLTPDHKDILFGHNTWDDYQCAGPRIFKHYSFPVLSYETVDSSGTSDTGSSSRSVNDSATNDENKMSGGTSRGNESMNIKKATKKDFRSEEMPTKSNDNDNNNKIKYADKAGVGNVHTENDDGVNNAFKKANDDEIFYQADIHSVRSGGHKQTTTVISSSLISSPDKDKSSATQSSSSSSVITQTHIAVISVPAELHFSSSPGFLTSMDDYLVVSATGDLAVMETSEDVIDEQILTQIQPQNTVLSWARVRVACQLASTAPHWARLFSYYHSGTYTNQWMVLDYAKFTSGRAPKKDDGLFIVLEEIPGLIHWEDMSHLLGSQGYWASYNNAYFDDIRDITGATDACENYDITYCYDTDPRALLFKKLQNKVVDVEAMEKMMDYNRYQTDKISEKDSCNTISCRGDLQDDEGYQYPFGAVDAKVSSILLSSRLHQPSSSSSSSSGSLTQSHSKQPSHSGEKEEDEMMKMMMKVSEQINLVEQQQQEQRQQRVESIDHSSSSSSSLRVPSHKSPTMIQTKSTDKKKSGHDKSSSDVDKSSDKNLFIPVIWARFGPTHDDQPPYCWSQFEDRRNMRERRYSHLGQPECFEYNWQLFPPPYDVVV